MAGKAPVSRAVVWVGLFWLAGSLVVGARSGPNVSGPPILFLAAASTTDAVTELAERFGKQSGIRIDVSTGGSHALAQQILAGAPAEVFLSANEKWAEAVVRQDKSLEVRALLGNDLVIVVPRGNAADILRPRDLLKKQVRHVALADENAPAGIYAEQCLRSARVYEALLRENRLVRGTDVRFALGFAATGEADAAVVYATDARASDRVEVVYRFAASAHHPVLYPLVLLKRAEKRPGARQFFRFLSSEAAMKVFSAYGFSPHPVPFVP